MKKGLKFAPILAVAIGLILLLRLFVCTVVTVGDNQLAPQFKAGDRLLVNRLNRNHLQNGDWVMFTDSMQHIGLIAGTPGDTIAVDTLQYEIPAHCCDRCDCDGCRLFLVEMGKNRILVKQKDIKGKTYKLFNLKLWW